MSHATTNLIRVFTLLSGAILAGCAQTVIDQTSSAAGTQIDYAYVAPGADFSRYSKLMTDGLEIYFPEQAAPLSPEDLRGIRTSFRTAFLGALGDDYPIVSVPGPDVLRIKAQVVDLNITGAGTTGSLSDVIATSELTFLMEMSDSMSNTMLARAADRSTNAAIDDNLAGSQVIDAAAEYWAGLFRSWLDRSVGSNAGD
jgi:hypothetical protein